MSDGTISQDEIDALLSGVSMDGLNSSGHISNGPAFNIDVKTLQGLADDLRPLLESKINGFTNGSFKAESPVVEALDRDKMLAKLPEVVVGVMADYTEGAKGSHFYLLSSDLALKLFALVNSETVSEIDDMVMSVVSEIISLHISSEIDNLDKTGNLPGLKYETPQTVNEPKAMVMFPQGDFAVTTYPLTLEGNAYTIWECLGGDVAEKFITALGGGVEEAEMLGASDPMGGAGLGNMGAMGGMGMGNPQMNMQQQMNPMGGMMPNMGMQQPMGGMQMNPMGGMMPNMGMQQPMGGMMPNMGMQQMPTGMNMGMNVPNIQQLQFPNLANSMNATEQGNIGLIMDVNMEMTVELGRTKKSIKDILGFGEGTIIELEKLAGEPVDILVNHKPIAKGEVVVIDENFGVRVTEILSPMERVNDLT